MTDMPCRREDRAAGMRQRPSLALTALLSCAQQEGRNVMQGPEDDPGLSGKVALISGGGAADDGIGNGRAAATLLARAGTKLMVADRALRLAQRTAEMFVAEGGTAVPPGCAV